MSQYSSYELDRRTFLAVGVSLIASTTMSKADEPLAPPDKQPPHVKTPEPPAKTVGWAIVGLGQLALEEVMPAFANSKIARPVALVSGHSDKAKKVAATYGIDPTSIDNYNTYEKLVDNPAVDVIYIILPNSMHAEYTVRGLKAGKHVLCEKPMATSIAECEQMIAAAKSSRKKLMIAYRLRHEPFNKTAIELCRKGELGKLKLITACNGQDVKAPNIRLSKSLGGGPLQDVGIYCVNAFRYLTGEEPIEVRGFAAQSNDDPHFREVPESVAFMLHFPSGVIASGDCSFGIGESRRYRVQGASGILDLENAFGYRGQRLCVQTEDRISEMKLSPVDHFAAEMDHFSECILTGRESKTPGEEGLADLRVMTAIEEAIQTGHRVTIKS
ncbi:MAG: gfo/Idh/MocA family oxidoreductase [Schlesneria sp.]|nr:gfo/Idh/MocA family oxidoreductase [Schlesneria sp.]